MTMAAPLQGAEHGPRAPGAARGPSIALLLAAVAGISAACGSSSRQPPSSVLQSDLRSLVSSAPHGDRVYWLGPQFHRAPVRFADASWGRYAILTYNRSQDIDVDVESFRSQISGAGKGYAVRTRAPSGQDVLLLFHSPARPSAALIHEAEAALAPVPAGVVYPPGHMKQSA
jgi:hypothetical protein